MCACVDVQLWSIDYMYLIAGILFFLSGVFYVCHEISPWLIPGAFPIPIIFIVCTVQFPLGQP